MEDIVTDAHIDAYKGSDADHIQHALFLVIDDSKVRTNEYALPQELDQISVSPRQLFRSFYETRQSTCENQGVTCNIASLKDTNRIASSKGDDSQSPCCYIASMISFSFTSSRISKPFCGVT